MKKTLVIMAAGMGSRFGGIKQIEPVGPNKEIISDYNIYNAVQNGFKKLVFVIRKKHLDIFKEDVVAKYKDKIEICFAFQEFDTVKILGDVPKEREKALGTAHALLCAREFVKDPFVVINADDFYGSVPFKVASNFMDENTISNEHLTINFSINNVVNLDMPVKRGICYSKNGIVEKISESEITVINDEYHAVDLTNGDKFIASEKVGCSVNMLVLKPSIFECLEEYFNEFSIDITMDNECYLPTCLSTYIDKGKIILKEEICNSVWISITYKEDAIEFKNDLNKMIEKGEYPRDLWKI